MKNTSKALCAFLILTAGCAQPSSSVKPSPTPDSSSEVRPVSGDAWDHFTEARDNAVSAGSRTAAVKSMYKMHFSDDTYNTYSFDGVLEEGADAAHIRENIYSNGMNSEIEGYYYNETLYNTYNGITYFEKMSLGDLEKSMLVPFTPLSVNKDQVKEITVLEAGNGNRIFHIYLKDTAAAAVFKDRYDFYDLSVYDSFAVTANHITDVFDADGHFITETTVFDTGIKYSGEEISVQYTSQVNLLKFDETEVALSDEQKAEHSAYVSFEDIDTSAITPSSSDDDTEEATAAATFEKRLQSRLNYEKQEDGTLLSKYNQNESYQVNIANSSFMYSNYSIHYTYSWKGDVGSMGACTYDFSSGFASNDCTDTTVKTIKDVKTYLQMELYYCGLSLDDLQKETSQGE